MQDKFNPYDPTSEAHQQALDAARAALDASYRADLADPYYNEHRRISHRTHRLWLEWTKLLWGNKKPDNEVRQEI